MAEEKHELGHVEKTSTDSSSREAEAQQELDWTPEEEKEIVKKADWRVFPMLCIVFGLSLLDRTNISSAYIAGLETDLKLNIDNRYNVALLIFFVPYALFELPSNVIIKRLGSRFWLSFLIVSWGACVLGMGFVKTWEVLTVLRALLGFFEAGLFPGAIYIIGSWYRQFETAKRVSIFYMASLLASGFGPILAYVLSLISVGDGMYSAGWRWIFIVEGIATIVAGLMAPFFLIEFPEKVRFLTDRQKHIAVTRVSMEKAGQQKKSPTFVESVKLLADWKVGVYCIQYFVSASSVYSLAFFKNIILRKGMGFSYALAQLLSSPPYMFAIIVSLTLAHVSDKIKLRWPIMIAQSLTACVGLLICLYGGPPGVRYFGLFLATFGTQANIPGTLAYGQNQTAQVHKRGVVAAAMISVGAAGGICGSTIFMEKHAPLYLPGMWATIAMQLLYSIITFCMSMYFKRMNKLADEGKRPALEGVEGFRYAP